MCLAPVTTNPSASLGEHVRNADSPDRPVLDFVDLLSFIVSIAGAVLGSCATLLWIAAAWDRLKKNDRASGRCEFFEKKRQWS